MTSVCFRSGMQFAGIAGIGCAVAKPRATYEWIAALGLIVVTKFFIPISLEKSVVVLAILIDFYCFWW